MSSKVPAPIFVSDSASNVVYAIDPTSKVLLATITVGNTPSIPQLTPDGSEVWVGCGGSSAMYVIKVATLTVTSIISTVVGGGNVTISPDGKTAFQPGSGAANPGSVFVFDVAAKTLRTVTFLHNNFGPSVGQFSLDSTMIYFHLFQTTFIPGPNNYAVVAMDVASLTPSYFGITDGGFGQTLLSLDGTTLYLIGAGAQIGFWNTGTHTYGSVADPTGLPIAATMSPDGLTIFITDRNGLLEFSTISNTITHNFVPGGGSINTAFPCGVSPDGSTVIFGNANTGAAPIPGTVWWYSTTTHSIIHSDLISSRVASCFVSTDGLTYIALRSDDGLTQFYNSSFTQIAAPATPAGQTGVVGTVTLPGGGIITQTGQTVFTIDSGATGDYVNHLNVTGETGTVVFSTNPLTPAQLASPHLTVSSTGVVATSGTLAPGFYTISGTSTDIFGNIGTWSFTLTVTSVPPPQTSVTATHQVLPTGIEIAVPFQIDSATGGVAILTDYASIVAQHLATVIMTVTGERVMLVKYGSHLQTAVFEPINNPQNAVLANNIKQALNQWEPAVNIVKVQVAGTAQDPTQLNVLVQFRVDPFPALNTVAISAGGTIQQVNAP